MSEMTVWQKIVYKFVGARYIVTLLMTATFCYITYTTLMLFFANLANKEVVDTIEKIAMFILGSFCTQMANVLASYFGRNDRVNPNDTNGNDQPVK